MFLLSVKPLKRPGTVFGVCTDARGFSDWPAIRTGSCADSVARHTNPANPANLLNIVSSDIHDEVLRARGADVLRVVDLVRADDADVARPEPVRLAGNGQLHHALADQHHLLA